MILWFGPPQNFALPSKDFWTFDGITWSKLYKEPVREQLNESVQEQ